MSEQVKKKAITNQRTPEEIKEIVAEIDAELPENLTEVMKEEEGSHEEEVVVTDEIETPEVEEVIEEELETPKKTLPSIEQRYRESGQEAMILNSKNKKILETIEEAENLPEPTIEELKAYALEMNTNYEDLEGFALAMLKENYQNKKRFGKISNLVTEEKQINKWVKTVEDFLDREDTLQNYPSLVNSAEEFIKYASKKTHMNADLDLLVAGFMFKQPKPVNNNSLLLGGNSGNGNKPEKPAIPTEEDAAIIRKKDFKKYKEMIKAKKFKTSF